MGGGAFDFVLVSAFGRGQWLAASLAQQGLKVALVDLSEGLGRWAPEDWEGPFGLFLPEKLSPSQLARINEEDDEDPVDDGFVLWLKSGPLDFKGPLSPHWLNREAWIQLTKTYLSDFEAASSEELRDWREKIEAMSFQNTWLIHLAHHLAANVYVDSAEAQKRGRPLPLFAPWALRRVTRKGMQKSLDWCASQGVEVYRSAELVDLLLDGALARGLEINSLSRKGVVLAEETLWMLTSEETFHLSDPIGSQLFPRGPIQPEWSWLRFRVALDLGLYVHTLPLKLVLIEELNLPWTHTNLMILDRTVNLQDVDVWIRVPTHLRFQRAYLEKSLDEILELLKGRIPHCQPRKVEMPQDFHYNRPELGPSRYGLYTPEALASLRPVRLRNLNFHGPEQWLALDWNSRFQADQQLLLKILRRREEQKQGEHRDHTLHPS